MTANVSAFGCILSAHTSGSGAALARTLREVFPEECVAVVVAMASDKDHRGFARAILEGKKAWLG